MKATEEQDLGITSDVSAQRVARVYAEALLNAAGKRGQADSVLEEIDALVRDLFRANDLLEPFLASGAISRHDKSEFIRTVFEPRASETLSNFLHVLNDHDRLGLLRQIRFEAMELQNERMRRRRVRVESAIPLRDEERAALTQQLRTTFECEPLLEARVNPELIGGLVVQVGDWLYDASLRTQLETIRHEFIERSSYEIQSGRNRFSAD